MNRFIAICVLAGISAACLADTATKVTVPTDVYALAGHNVKIPIQMTNAASQVAGYQAKLTLPESTLFGGDVTLTALESNLDWAGAAIQSDMTSAMMLSYSTSCQTLAAADDAADVALLSFTLADDVEVGPYKCHLSDFVTSDAEGTATYLDDDIAFNLHVLDANCGYHLTVTPMQMEAAETATIAIKLTSEKDIQSVSFKTSMPKGFTVADPNINICSLNTRKADDFSLSAIPTDACTAYTLASGNNATAAYIECGVKEDVITVSLTTQNVDAGKYTISLSDITMVDVDGNTISLSDYAADIYIGEVSNEIAQVSDGTVTFSGDYSDPDDFFNLIATAMPADDVTLKTVDMTGVTAVPDDAVITVNAMANPNALIRTKANLGLKLKVGEAEASTDNIVAGDHCDRLILTDKHPFCNTDVFTADEVAYSRSGMKEWGTLFLPFDIKASSDMELYVLAESTLIDLKFTKISEVAANTPCIYHLCNADQTSKDLSATNISIPVAGGVNTIEGEVADWMTCGTMDAKTFVVTDVENEAYGKRLYYFSSADGKIYWSTGRLTVSPFRAWFEYTGKLALGSSMRTEFDNSTVGIEFVGDDKVLDEGTLYDLDGKRAKEVQHGQSYILNGMKVMFE